MRIWAQFTVEPAEAGRSLGAVLRSRWRLSRTLTRQLKRSGGILVNGVVAPISARLAAGDVVALAEPPAEGPSAFPEPMPLRVLWEDQHLIALDKPPGLVVHPSRGHPAGTLVNGLAWWLRAHGHSGRVHPVGRLDRETSGVILFAKHPYAHERLARDLQGGGLRREYLALAWGCWGGGEVIDLPISREAEPSGRRWVAEGGERAVTHVQVLWRGRRASLLRLRLETGRTHQIRVHLSHLGHPLLGDALYGAPPEGPLRRVALHAWRLVFRHPVSGETVRLRAPVPPDLRAGIAWLRGERP